MKRKENKDDFIALVSSTEWNVDELILTDIAYSEMVNIGGLNLIRDAQLKAKITNYYRNYEFIALRVTELNPSHLETINAAALVAPHLKYAIKGYAGLLPKEIFSDHNYM